MDLEKIRFWGNDAKHWLIALGIAVAVVVTIRLIKALFRSRIGKVAAKTGTILDDAVVDMVDGTRWFFYLALAAWGGARALDLSKRAANILEHVVIVAVLVQVGVWLTVAARCLVKSWQRRHGEDRAEQTASQAVGFVARLVIWTLVLLSVLSSVGIEISALVAGLGVGGVAAALAVQSLFGDVIASLSIYFDRPFDIGDFIIVGDALGTVERIGWRSTRVRSLGGEQLIFANGELIKQRIANYGRMLERRIAFSVGIEYGTPAAKVERAVELLRESVQAVENTRLDRAHFKAFGDYSLVFEVVYFVLSPDYTVFMDAQQAVNLGIMRRFEQEDLAFAFPTRTLHVLPSERPARIQLESREAADKGNGASRELRE